jgi:hypothetical protein
MTTTEDLAFTHRFEPARDTALPPLLLLHGTGGKQGRWGRNSPGPFFLFPSFWGRRAGWLWKGRSGWNRPVAPEV